MVQKQIHIIIVDTEILMFNKNSSYQISPKF